MFEILYNYQDPWPENESRQLHVQFNHEIVISPDVARRKANGFLAGHISMMVSAKRPTLILNNVPTWRVTAVLMLPEVGEAGIIGTIDISAQTGEIKLPSTEEIHHMQELAHAIATHFTLPTKSAI